jgi:hypothetical protein
VEDLGKSSVIFTGAFRFGFTVVAATGAGRDGPASS